MPRLLAVVVLAVLALGCDTDAPPSNTTSAPIALPAALREARTKPQPDGSIVIEAVSARVLLGQPYLFPVFTHCGFTTASFDFDGSFWAVIEAPANAAAEGANPPPGIDNPTDNGVIVLTAADRAAWRSRGGIVFELARGPGGTKVFGCD